MSVDSHCHVHFRAYQHEQEDLIKKTLQSGVFMVTVGTQLETSKQAIACAEQHDGVFASIGLHPEHTINQDFVDENETSVHHPAEVFDVNAYKALAQSAKCVAIGECGLDYYRVPDGIDEDEFKRKQMNALRAQFDLADELHKPVIIHCRDAYEDQLAVNQEYIDAGKLVCRGVVHCFSGSLDVAKQFVVQGFLLGFTGVITFPPKKSDVLIDGLTSLQHVIKEIPLESILIETDAPYLTPIPFRGKRNEPAYVKYVAEKVAEIKGVPIEDVEAVTTQNAKRLFQLPM